MVCLEIYVGSTTVLASQIDLPPGTPSSRDNILPRDMLAGDPPKKLWLTPIAASEEIFRYIACGVAPSKTTFIRTVDSAQGYMW